MKIKVLVANENMDVHQLMRDIIEINFRDVEITRALSAESFWEKIKEPRHLVLIGADFIKEDSEAFIDRLKAANPDALGNVIIIGNKEDRDTLDEDAKQLPFLAKPFSLDDFEEIVKFVQT